MNRLVAFGCSHTFGYALPDTIQDPSKPSELAWPSILSKDLGLELVNKGLTGISNHRILFEILNSELHESDLVIIFWTNMHRSVIFNNKCDMVDIGSWKSDDTTRSYFELHSNMDLAVSTLLDIHHAELFCNRNGITTKHFLLMDRLTAIDIAKRKCKWADTHFEYIDLTKFKRDLATDNLHCGVETHQELSNYVKQVLKNEGKI